MDALEIIIKKTAKLAKIELPANETERYTKKAQAILDYIKTLEELNVENVEAMSHAVSSQGSLREDEVVPSTLADELLELAPERDERYVQVPTVMESET